MNFCARDHLQELANDLRTSEQSEVLIEFRGSRSGWWAIAETPRWFNDEGEYLGSNWKEAEKTLRLILG